MMLTTVPCANRVLEEKVRAALNRWLIYRPLQANEYLCISANDVGEIRLWGLVSSIYPVESAALFLSSMPGVKRVVNEVTRIYAGTPVNF